MKNRSIAFTLMGLFLSASVFAQRTGSNNEEDSSSKELPKYADVNGYHAGNYKQPHKAKMAAAKNNLIAAESAETSVALNYKMPFNKTLVKKVSAPADNKKVIRNYKMPYNN